ncbi:MAG: Xaa-Pro peptidase family protein [Conexivisphaerales archaeon]
MASKSRFARIFERLDDGVDVIAIVNGMKVDTNFFYITGYTSGIFENSYCFLFRDGHVEVVTSPLEEQAARQKDYEVHIINSSDPDSLAKTTNEILNGIKKVGVNFRGITHKDYLVFANIIKQRTIVDASEALDIARRIKDSDELEAISKACSIISEVADRVPEMLKTGMTESDLRAEIEYETMKRGASPSFPSIVAFGENSAIPHYSPSNRKLKSGDTVLVDIGAKYKLYCSDITRTFFYKEASRQQKEMYEVVSNAQKRSIDAIKQGVKGKDVYEIALKTIDSTKFAGRFIHGLGHHLGIEVHDGFGRALSRNGEDALQKGMVLTVEPGVYLPGKGGVRIEDDVVVTEKGAKLLTTAGKELTIVK